MPDAAPRIAVAVVSYNTRELLAACLASMREDPRLHVVVVDNASADGSVEMVRERFPEVELIARDDNLGFGAAVNLALSTPEARAAEWVAPSNADVELTAGAVDALLRAADADPVAAAFAPRLVLPDGSTQHSTHNFWSPLFALQFNAGRPARDPRWADEQCLEGQTDLDRPRRVPWAIGAFLLIRRDAWDAVGGFDEGQWLYAEDLDLGWRLHRAGRPTRYVPDARVLHAESASIGPVWGDEKVERWTAASYDWMYRRRGTARALTTAALNTLGPLLRSTRPRSPGHAAELRHWASLHAIGLRGPRGVRRRLPRPPA